MLYLAERSIVLGMESILARNACMLSKLPIRAIYIVLEFESILPEGTMTHNIHDSTFKQILSHEQHFVDFCKAYLPGDIKAKINWRTLKLYKLNQEFIDHIQDEQQKHIADVVYAVNYRDKIDDRECLILVHSEHQGKPDRLLPLRLAHYKLAMLLDYARTHPKKTFASGHFRGILSRQNNTLSS